MRRDLIEKIVSKLLIGIVLGVALFLMPPELPRFIIVATSLILLILF